MPNRSLLRSSPAQRSLARLEWPSPTPVSTVAPAVCGLSSSRLIAALALCVGLAGCAKKAPVKVVVPEVYRVKFATSQGDFVVEVHRDWAPRGADRFYELLGMKYFDENRFFRVLPKFIAQFGVNKDFRVHDVWREYFIVDDKPKEKNLRGTLAFAQSGPNTRATEVFINLADNKDLDEQGFVPFAKIVAGMDVPDKLYSGYGEWGPKGPGPDSGRIEEEANEYLVPRFPKLDYIKTARLVQ